MNLVSIGISHHTAGVDVRERMWLSAEEARRAVAELRERFFAECMLVSTCNRTEIYGMERGAPVSPEDLKSYLISFKNAEGLRAVARSLSSGDVLVETDCPYLAPLPRYFSINPAPFRLTHFVRLSSSQRSNHPIGHSRPLVRCTNNGLTCWIDRNGRIRQSFSDKSGSAYGAGFLTVLLPLPPTTGEPVETYYQRHGDWFGWSCVGLAAALLLSTFGHPGKR